MQIRMAIITIAAFQSFDTSLAFNQTEAIPMNKHSAMKGKPRYWYQTNIKIRYNRSKNYLVETRLVEDFDSLDKQYIQSLHKFALW